MTENRMAFPWFVLLLGAATWGFGAYAASPLPAADDAGILAAVEAAVESASPDPVISSILDLHTVLTPGVGVANAFGFSVAMLGDTVVVGATGGNGNQANNSISEAGAAYVFVRANGQWTQQAYRKASNPRLTQGIRFGSAVGVSGDSVVVGAPVENSPATGVNGSDGIQSDNQSPGYGSGAAYVFVREGNSWRQQAYLKGNQVGYNFCFGESVGISGDTVVVGSPQDEGGCGSNALGPIKCGSAFVFVRNRVSVVGCV